eukprot:bmy_21352T0
MRLQNQRGGRLHFQDIRKPVSDEWKSGLKAMWYTLCLEKRVNPEPARPAPAGHRQERPPPASLPGNSLPQPAGGVHQRAGGSCHHPEHDGGPGRRPGRVPL